MVYWIYHLNSSISVHLKATFSQDLLQVLLIILTLSLLVNPGISSVCTASSSNSNVITTEQCSFNTFTSSTMLGVASGSISGSLYSLY